MIGHSGNTRTRLFYPVELSFLNRNPSTDQIYAINTGPLTGQDGGTLQRVELKGRTLILSADHPDKSAYPTRTFAVKAATLPEVLVGQVMWVGRTLTRP